MLRINYKTLEEQGYHGFLMPQKAPIKVLQFGEGNFLRAFVDNYLDQANELIGWNGKVCMLLPTNRHPSTADQLNAQDCLYTVYTRGKEHDEIIDCTRIVSSVACCLNPYKEPDYETMIELAASDSLELIVSNTTEAGIVYDPACGPDDRPPSSFPAKLTQLLHARWLAGGTGLTVLSCELIDNNGDELLLIVKQHARDWEWENGFIAWLENECSFCTTLVDSIVPGLVRDPTESSAIEERIGYTDPFLTVREPFQMWGIQGPPELEKKIPVTDAKLPGAFITQDVTPYKKRKVRIMNGAHTGFAPGAWLAGFDVVRNCMHDDAIKGFISSLIYGEVIPTLSPELDEDDLNSFASTVFDRFDNPFIDHQLLSICLNSTSKWRARDLPTFLEYIDAEHELPTCLTMSLAMLIAFYTTGFEGLESDGLHLHREDGTPYIAQDDSKVLNFYADRVHLSDYELVHEVLACNFMWGRDLTSIPDLESTVSCNLAYIRTQGAHKSFELCVE